MKKTIFGMAAALGMAASSVCSASLVVEYNGVAGTTQAAINGSDAIGFDLARGAGIGVGSGGNFNSNGFSAATLADAINDDEYLTFGFNVGGGVQLAMTDIMVEMDNSGTGPDTLYLLYDANGDGFDVGDLLQTEAIVNDPVAPTVFNSGLPMDLTAGDGAVEFRFYFTGATSGSGTADIEDDLIGGTTGQVGLQLNGTFTPVPEPTSGIILLGLAAGVAIRRRR